ncbi:DASS family sodium-coupled anion symporter [Candidatus Bathyarchaeota archaeon]|nr:DASS family sodium-coupled anion symporter [Candidatus Bathyarchaeota archaeon]
MTFGKALKFVVVVVLALLAYFMTAPLESEMRVTFALLAMASALWITEALPLGVTALIIALAQPLLGIQPFRDALEPFFDPIIALFLGALFLAIAFEKQDLDEILAQRILERLGDNAKTLVLGMMFIAAFLAMWMTITATAALMIPLALRLTIEAKREKDKENFSKIMVLSMAYAASAGAIASLVGTPPNLIAAGLLQRIVGYNLTFVRWGLYGLPISIVLILLIWVLLFRFFPIEAKKVQKPKERFTSLNKKQKLTLAIFVLAVVLWVTRQLPDPIAAFIGWQGHGISESMVAIFIAVLLFLPGLLGQNDIAKIDWNTLLLFGGGLSLGSALEVSGLTDWIGLNLTNAVGTGSYITLFVILGFSTLVFTMIASNTACANILVPIAISVGLTTGISPAILAVFTAIVSTLDFMLPIGTPANAIAYSTGKVKMREMVKTGLLLDIVGVLVTIAFALTIWTLVPT